MMKPEEQDQTTRKRKEKNLQGRNIKRNVLYYPKMANLPSILVDEEEESVVKGLEHQQNHRRKLLQTKKRHNHREAGNSQNTK